MKHFEPTKRPLPPIGSRCWLDSGWCIELVTITNHVGDEHVSVRTDEGSKYLRVHVSNLSL